MAGKKKKKKNGTKEMNGNEKQQRENGKIKVKADKESVPVHFFLKLRLGKPEAVMLVTRPQDEDRL